MLSARHTVLEIAGLDRPGLLYDLTTAIGKLNLNIASAHIATFGEKAVDVFYVTDLTNAKIVSTARQLDHPQGAAGRVHARMAEKAPSPPRARAAGPCLI